MRMATIFIATVLGASMLSAQSMTAELKMQWDGIKGNVLKAPPQVMPAPPMRSAIPSSVQAGVTFEIAFMLVLIGAALVLFVLEVFPIEVTAMLLLAVLLVTGILTVDEAISGLSNKAVVTVAAMLVLGQALVKTGVLAAAADRIRVLIIYYYLIH